MDKLAVAMPTSTQEQFEQDKKEFNKMIEFLGYTSRAAFARSLGMSPDTMKSVINRAKNDGTKFPYNNLVHIHKATLSKISDLLDLESKR